MPIQYLIITHMTFSFDTLEKIENNGLLAFITVYIKYKKYVGMSFINFK